MAQHRLTMVHLKILILIAKEGSGFFGGKKTQIKPQSEMGPLESHRLWANVTNAINAKDYATASREKSQIEEAQRALARERKEKGETQADALQVFELVPEDNDETGKAFAELKKVLIETVGAKALKEDDNKPHWRLRNQVRW